MVKYLRKLVSNARANARRVGMLLLVLVGFATAVPAQTSSSDTINERVTRIRVRLQNEEPQAVEPLTAADDGAEVNQWGNWGNWGNWRNWSNWNNWRNWGNWGNWHNF